MFGQRKRLSSTPRETSRPQKRLLMITGFLLKKRRLLVYVAPPTVGELVFHMTQLT